MLIKTSRRGKQESTRLPISIGKAGEKGEISEKRSRIGFEQMFDSSSTSCTEDSSDFGTDSWRQDCLRSYQRASQLEQAIQQIEHQLRSPLALIELHTDILLQQSLSELPSAAEIQRSLQSVQKLIADMGFSLERLAGDGLSTQRSLSCCDLCSIIQETVDMLRPKIEQKRLSVLCDRTSLFLMTDRWQMQQVFSNLLHNAISFSPEGGIIDCRWQVFQQEILIEIRDQGPGFSSEDLASLFTPFYSRRPGGKGLGLAIVQQIVVAHQGSLWASNLPEGGAQMSISLPRSTNTFS